MSFSYDLPLGNLIDWPRTYNEPDECGCRRLIETMPDLGEPFCPLRPTGCRGVKRIVRCGEGDERDLRALQLLRQDLQTKAVPGLFESVGFPAGSE